MVSKLVGLRHACPHCNDICYLNLPVFTQFAETDYHFYILQHSTNLSACPVAKFLDVFRYIFSSPRLGSIDKFIMVMPGLSIESLKKHKSVSMPSGPAAVGRYAFFFSFPKTSRALHVSTKVKLKFSIDTVSFFS